MFSAKDIFQTKAKAGGYTIAKSLRFRSSASAYLSRTFGTPTNNLKWTASFWMKKGGLGTSVSSGDQAFISAPNAGNIDAFWIEDNGTDQFSFHINSVAVARWTPVYRDVSAWYHVVFVYDSANATQANRLLLYINGTQITSLSTAVSLSLNQATTINANAVASRIGNNSINTRCFDGYLTEVNFIDGQALTPSDFGQTDTATGVWMPKKYSGTYGNNGFYLPFTLNSASSYAGSFNGSTQYVTTPTSANLALGSGDFTIECWFNQTTQNNNGIVCQDYAAGVDIRINEGGSNNIGFYAGSATFVSGTYSGAGQWHHLAVVRNGSGSNNLKLYVDGILICQATNTTNLTANQFRVGSHITGGTVGGATFNGSISNVRVVKGTAVYTAPFTPPSAALTAVTNTQLLTMQNATVIDNSSNAFTLTNTGSVATSAATPFVESIANDASGQNNGWTPNNINYSSPGVTYDSMVDTPTNYDNGGNGAGNYCVLNPLDKNSSLTVSDGNLGFNASTTASQGVRATFAIPSGIKVYAECQFSSASVAANYTQFGIATSTASLSADIGNTSGTGFTIEANGATDTRLRLNGTSVTITGAVASGDVLRLAVDYDNNKVWLGKNTVWYDSAGGTTGDPATGANATGTLTASTVYFPAVLKYNTTSFASVNFGQRGFTYSVPSGFKALCTQNLPTPTIGATSSTLANKYFDILTWTGNGALTTRTGLSLGTAPGMVWLKGRSVAGDHTIVDSNRGTGVVFSPATNATNAEGSSGGGWVQNLSTTGFSTDVNGPINTNGTTYVSWVWAGGSNVSNTSGSITSTVSANVTAGFSVVTYTSPNLTTDQTVGHGLGVAPAFIITKNRDSAFNWDIWHKNLSAGYGLIFATDAATTGRWPTTAPTSSVFSVKYNYEHNSTNKYVAYCFAEVAGYSKFGSLTGNASADGSFVYLGFKPKLILIKCSSTTGNWYMFDTVRNTYNVLGEQLYPNLSNAGSTVTTLDALSNGFKLRLTGDPNAAQTYIFAAWADVPFNFARAM